MKISLNTLRFINQHYGSAADPAPYGVDAIIEKIGAQLGAVEEVTHFGDCFKGALIVTIVSCEDHPNADRLHVCKIDDGGRAADVERDEKGYVDVVCGAPNAREGINVVWLPPGVTVPNTVGKDPYVLEARALRGVISNGMLASPRELTIGDSHEGILEVATDSDEHIAPGTAFSEAYHLDGDVVIDMENKMFTHRPDCFGYLGIARELEGIQHRAYKSPDWYTSDPVFPAIEADELTLEVRNEIPDLVPRFTAITMRDIQVKESPLWLQIDLAKSGIRSINNIVDYSNFFMLETGQPLHVYDYDRVVAQDNNADHATIVIRKPRSSERILLLNGKEIQPRAEAIMIATNDKLLGVGGVMGGGETEVDQNTKNIIIEVANFDMYSVRRTSMAHGLFTDAVTRFSKGQSSLQNRAVLAKIVDEIRRFAGGKVASNVIDDNHVDSVALERNSVYEPVLVSRTFINSRLGFELSANEMAELLRNVEFDVQIVYDNLTVKAPFWRTDIAIPEDVVEEVGRLYGFDHLPLELPKRDLAPAPKNPLLEVKAEIRAILSKAGANEMLSYSFVHGNLLKKVGQDKNFAFQVSNALSPDLQYYRMTLTPSLLDKVHSNIKAGYDEFVIFEINKTHNKLHFTPDVLPAEYEMLALTVAANDRVAHHKQGSPYYQARAYLDFLATAFNIELDYNPLTEPLDYPVGKPFDYKRSAIVCLKGTKDVVGIIGEYRALVIKNLKLPAYTAGFEVSPEALMNARATRTHSYASLPRFPRVEQDITLRVSGAVKYQDLAACIDGHLATSRLAQTHYTLAAVDIYQPKDDIDHKHITFRLTIASFERTLTDKEVSTLLNDVAAKTANELDAKQV